MTKRYDPRLARIEQRLTPPEDRPEFWFREGDTVRQPHTGEVITVREWDRRYPTGRKFTLKIGDAEVHG